jgi:hypothetical protein
MRKTPWASTGHAAERLAPFRPIRAYSQKLDERCYGASMSLYPGCTGATRPLATVPPHEPRLPGHIPHPGGCSRARDIE